MLESLLSPENLTDPQFHAEGSPQQLWQQMRKHSPVYWHDPKIYPGFWSITQYEDIRAIYSDPMTFSSADGVLLRPIKCGSDPAGGLTLALTDPPRHKKLRSILSNWFTMPYAKSIEYVVQKKIQTLISYARNKGNFDFTHDIAAPLALYVTCYILGVPEEDQQKVFDWTHEAFEVGNSLAAHNHFMLYFGDFMEAKMACPGDDLASALINGTVDNEFLAEDEILLNFENLLGATENAGLSMAGGILAMLKFPSCWNILRNDRNLLGTTIEEILRWSSSATHSMRTVTKPVLLKERQLKPKDKVVLWLPSANRDDKQFKDPFIFDITRRPNRHVALGFGEHFCIGNALARVQMKALLNALLDIEQQLRLTQEPTPLESIHVNGPKILPVHFV